LLFHLILSVFLIKTIINNKIYIHFGDCMKLKEITSKKYSCVIGACPAIFENKNNYLIIGKKLDANKFNLGNRVGSGEVLVEIPKKIIDKKAL